MTLALTVKGVANAKPGDHMIDGVRGLILRVDDRGRRVWRLRGTLRGAMKVWTLGDHPRVSVAEVRKLHADARHALDNGEDPRLLIERWHASKIPGAGVAGGPTVADVVAEFMTVAKRDRKRPEIAQSIFDRDVLPKLGDVAVAALTKRHFVELLDGIVARGSRVAANRTQALIRQAFAVAADRDLIPAVPAMPRAPVGGAERARDRVLEDSEIGALWVGLDKLAPIGRRGKIGRPLALALRLLLVTAQRRGELASARWEDIVDHTTEVAAPDGEKQAVTFKVWRIPDSKTGVPSEVPLSDLACRLLDELAAYSGQTGPLLPSTRTGEVNEERDRYITRAARTVRSELKMADWRPHDLRRTARTGMARLGVPDAIAERVLNHATGDRMIAVYNRHGYLLEKRDALARWAEHVEHIVANARRATNCR